jgi:hypothetical protein
LVGDDKIKYFKSYGTGIPAILALIPLKKLDPGGHISGSGSAFVGKDGSKSVFA